MIERRIVRRYASALFGAAARADQVDRVESDLGLVSYVVESSPALWDAITSPVIPPEKKREILGDIFSDKVSEITLSYLRLLVDKRREEAITHTEPEYIALANEARGIIQAEVTSACPLDSEQESRLVAKLCTVTGKRIELAKKVDPTVIAGVLVRIGDTLIDGTIRGQLAALRERLLES
jgi:F-type H+-transporting ATPase subunit delta